MPAARGLSEHFPRAATGFPYSVVLDVFAPQPMKQAHVLAYCTRDTRAFVCVCTHYSCTRDTRAVDHLAYV